MEKNTLSNLKYWTDVKQVTVSNNHVIKWREIPNGFHLMFIVCDVIICDVIIAVLK